MALLHALSIHGREMGAGAVIAGHVDHGLRAESREDAAAVEEVCRRLEIPFQLERVKVEGRGGLQAAARRARYQALERMRARVGACRILTAHTADDQAETLLLRLARGTSTTGLAGIRETSGYLVRPLLGVSRELLASYCRDEGVPVREDPSNEDPRFLRVRARREILPLIESRLGSGAGDALCRLARIAAEEDAFLEAAVLGLEQRARSGEGGLRREVLVDAAPALTRRLLAKEWRRTDATPAGQGLSPPPVESAHISRLMDLLNRRPSWEANLPGGVTAVLSCGVLMFGRGPWPRPASLTIRSPGRYEWGENGRFVLASEAPADEKRLVSKLRAYVAWSPGAEILVRGWAPGDRLEDGSSVADLLRRAGIPRPLRASVPVVLKDGRLLWVLGVRAPSVVPSGPALELRLSEGEGTARTEG